MNQTQEIKFNNPITKIANAKGYIIGSDGNVYGWKCLACSTAHVFENSWEIEQCADAVNQWQQSHESCN